jgi:hypothetical protein
MLAGSRGRNHYDHDPSISHHQVPGRCGRRYAAEIDAVDQAATSARSSLSAAMNSPSAQTVSSLGKAVQSLGTALSTLRDSVQSTC